MSAWRTPRLSRSATMAASATSSTAYTRGSPSDCDERMYPQRAHWPIVVPETPASSPTSPASRRPWTDMPPCSRGDRRLELDDFQFAERVAAVVDDLEHEIQPRDLERVGEAGIDVDDHELAAARPHALLGADQRAQAGRVHEVRVRQIDDHARAALVDGVRERGLEVGCRVEVDLAGDGDDVAPCVERLVRDFKPGGQVSRPVDCWGSRP